MMLRNTYLLFLLILPTVVIADDLRPALLELRESTPERYQVLWKTPSKGGAPLRISPVLPENCQDISGKNQLRERAVSITRWAVHCPGGLANKTISIQGMDGLLTEVLVRIQGSEDTLQVGRLSSLTPVFTVPATPDFFDTAGTYLKYGVSHILAGFDHLLFVFALILLISNKWQVVTAITSFTVAHSLTLGISALGIFRPPQGAIEAVIALSILFLAVELIKRERGFPSITANNPWMIAFAFGLLHGFGFASALLETGLPQQDIPVALLFFNLGVEAGQLLFIAVVISLGYLLKALFSPRAEFRTASHYAIGSIAAFWTVERVVGFWV